MNQEVPYQTDYRRTTGTNALVSRGRAAAYKQTHARILLMSDESRSDGGMKDADITSALGVGQSTVERIRKRCVEEGVESALNRKKQLLTFHLSHMRAPTKFKNPRKRDDSLSKREKICR